MAHERNWDGPDDELARVQRELDRLVDMRGVGVLTDPKATDYRELCRREKELLAIEWTSESPVRAQVAG